MSALQLNYSPSYTLSDGDKRVEADTVRTIGDVHDAYVFSPILSNKKKSEYVQQRGGVGLNLFPNKEFRATVGLDFQHATLKGEQTYPYEYDSRHTFRSVMPSVELRFSRSKTSNLRLNYRTSTSAPSISQLQNVIDVSNVRVYTGGNPDLSQQYSHSIRLYAAGNRVETSRFIFLSADMTVTNGYITTSSVIARKDSVIDNDIILPAGTQYNKPTNIDGFYSGRINLTLSSPVSWLGSNLSVRLGANMQHKPSLYNYSRVVSNTYALSGGLTLGSSFSENVDFNVGYNGTYNIVKSTQTAANNYNYYNHNINADINCIFARRFVLNNSLNHNMRSGMGDGYDNNYLGWNAAFAVKFFKDLRGELRLRVNDVLNTSESVTRSIKDAYVQTSRTDVLGRYAMLTFSYKFKMVGSMPVKDDKGEGRPPMGDRGGRGARGDMPGGGRGPQGW